MELVSLVLLLVPQSGALLGPGRAPTVLEGQVVTSEGLPASGAIVVSDAGGKAVVGDDGWFRFELELPAERSELRVTAALGSGPSGSMGSTSVLVPPSRGVLPVGALHLDSAGACLAEWLPTFGTAAGTDRSVSTLAVLDDGSGPALYVGGEFLRAGDVIANGIAKWDGGRWSQLGHGFGDGFADEPPEIWVNALAMFDDGSGPVLYAGGALGNIESEPAFAAGWDGARWKSLGLNRFVRAMVVFDDGTGPALYVGGDFVGTDFGDDVAYVAKWDGNDWTALGDGVDRNVFALTVFDDGSGPALYAGGIFTTAGDLPANRIAKWNGKVWSALGSGTNGSVTALAALDDGSGPALYASGGFTFAGGSGAKRIAKWDGAAWSALGHGLNNVAEALAVFDDGGGPALFAAGSFTTAGDAPANYVARWDGSSWVAVGNDTSWEANALTVFDDGSGAKLYMGGNFEQADGKEVSNLASWNGADWQPIGGSPFGHDGPVRVTDLAVLDRGGENAPELYAACFVTNEDYGPNVARWDGTAWTLLGSRANNYINAVAVFDDGSGPALYTAGEFTSIGGVSADHVARWDGASWTQVGAGIGGQVLSLAVFDDGGGDALYAGGTFTSAGGSPIARIARWDGATWTPLAGGPEFAVCDMRVFDDGSGDALYAGGIVWTSGGTAMDRIARWDGAAWTPLGTGIDGGEWPIVLALEVFDDGSGPALYAGGTFTIAGGATVANLARWDGTAWTSVGGGVSATDEPSIQDLQVFDDGSGPALYAGGLFTSAGGVSASHVARWDGASWATLGRGISNLPPFSPDIPFVLPPVRTLAVFPGSNGNAALFVGGIFYGAVDSADSYLARWQGCFDITAPTIQHPPDLFVRDVPGTPPGEVVTFVVTATDNKDPITSVTCTPPSGSLFPPGATLVTCESKDSTGNVARATFRVVVASKARAHDGPR